MELSYVNDVVHPAVEGLKSKYFGSHPDEPIILHRKELLNRTPPFHALRDPWLGLEFDDEFLSLLQNLDYVVITAVIDKLEHKERYVVWQFDPYHYCLTVLVERYVRWLKRRNATGDVMAESRGGQADRRLKDSFARVYGRGSDFVAPQIVAAQLTSKQLKLKTKSNNISGLQLADLLAHPSYAATKARRQGQALPDNFGGKIAAILEAMKYDRGGRGRIDGWGKKWLP